MRIENLTDYGCGYAYSGKPDVGGKHDPVNWMKWGTDVLARLRVVPIDGDRFSQNAATELLKRALLEFSDIDVVIIDVKELRN